MRARRIRLHPRTVEKLTRLRKEADRDGAYRVANRIHAVTLNAKGKTSGEIAELLESPRARVSEWLRNYEEHGYEGLLEGHRSGRPSRLTEVQKEMLSDIVESGPVAYGYLSGVWTSVMIGQVIRDEFGITYQPRSVRHLLNQLGFSMQRPKRILANADPVKQDRWRRYTYPNIKKKRVQLGRR